MLKYILKVRLGEQHVGICAKIYGEMGEKEISMEKTIVDVIEAATGRSPRASELDKLIHSSSERSRETTMYDSISNRGLYRYFSSVVCIPRQGEVTARNFHSRYTCGISIIIPVRSYNSFLGALYYFLGSAGKIAPRAARERLLLLLLIIERCYCLRRAVKYRASVFFTLLPSWVFPLSRTKLLVSLLTKKRKKKNERRIESHSSVEVDHYERVEWREKERERESQVSVSDGTHPRRGLTVQEVAADAREGWNCVRNVSRPYRRFVRNKITRGSNGERESTRGRKGRGRRSK